MAWNIFELPILQDYILPFLLVWVLIFAILQKVKFFGEGKKQIDTIISIIVALIFVAIPYARNFTVGMIPALAIGIIVIFVFLLLFMFVSQKAEIPGWMTGIFTPLIAIFVLGFVIKISGAWSFLSEKLTGVSWISVIFTIIVIGAVIAVLIGSKGGKE